MTNQKTNSQLLQDERPAFEAAYAAEFSGARGIEYTAEDIALLREGDGYGERPYLNGHWKGWQARAALARVAELEKQEPFAFYYHGEPGYTALVLAFMPPPEGEGFERITGKFPLYRNPVAQAGQVPEEVRTLLSRAKCEIEHLAECLENVCEDEEDVDVREDVADGRVVAADIAHMLAATPAQGGE